MFRRLNLAALPAAASMALMVIGCAKSASTSTPVAVTLADYTITVPATIPAALTTFSVVNQGKEVHQAALARLDSGKTAADFMNAMKVQGPPPAWIVWVGGADSSPGLTSEVTIPLEAGNYVWYCIIPDTAGIPHAMKGMTAPMTVTAGSGVASAPPTSDVDVSVHDYTWDMSTPLTAGKHTLKVSTTTGQAHELVIVRLADGKTAQDFTTWAMKMAGPPPADLVTGVAVLQPGQVNYLTADFKPGHYAFICFVPDKADGQPHFTHGMVKDVTIQ